MAANRSKLRRCAAAGRTRGRFFDRFRTHRLVLVENLRRRLQRRFRTMRVKRRRPPPHAQHLAYRRIPRMTAIAVPAAETMLA